MLHFQLARQGLNVVIMSRSQDKLQLVANEISELIGSGFTLSLFSTSSPSTHVFSPEEKYGREVRIIPVDFSGGSEIYPQIAENLQDLDIGVLGEGRATDSPPPHTHTHTHKPPNSNRYKLW